MFDSIIGNDNIKLQLRTAAKAAKITNSSMGHTIFCGPPGVGKTSFARAISEEFDFPFFQVGPDSLKKPADLLELFNKLDSTGYSDTGDIVGEINPSLIFIDEIHGLSSRIQESIGIALENWVIEAQVESLFSDAKTTGLYWLPRFTLIGATTLPGTSGPRPGR